MNDFPDRLKFCVPSVLRIGGLRVAIYPNDHRPAHVHVSGGGGEAVLNLHFPNGPVELREVYGFGRLQIARIKEALQERLVLLCAEWERIHGRP